MGLNLRQELCWQVWSGNQGYCLSMMSDKPLGSMAANGRGKATLRTGQ